MQNISKFCALAATLTMLAMPLSAFAADGKGGSSPDCQTKGNQSTTARTCENSKAPGSGGGNGAGNGG